MMIPPPQRAGAPIMASWLNQLRDALLQILVPGDGVTIGRVGNGVQVGTSKISPISSGPVSTVRITGVYGDYVTGVVINAVSGSDSGAEIAVAKPFQLRQTPFDGQTITFPNGDEISYAYDATYPERKRVATINSVDYTEYITPMYNEDEEITVVRVPTGATGGYGEALFWADINDAARAWAVL